MGSLEDIRDLIKSCLLPELKEDLDSIPIAREHFKNYHEYLETHLPFLYDCIQRTPEKFVWNGEATEVPNKEIQVYLIVLLCEISCPSSIFKLNQTELVYNANRILQNSTNLFTELHDSIFIYYEDKLHKDKWKKQIGAVHGFVKYLEFRFSANCNLDQTMCQKLIRFCLSVALNIRSCYETHYKTLSTAIFMIILQHGANDGIISMNIHSVIYDAVFKDICILESTCFIMQQWNCLIKCLDFYENFDSFTWNYLDDIMEVLLRNISLSSDSATSLCLLKFVKKLIVYFTINNKEFEEKIIDKDLTLLENVIECRSLSKYNTSFTCYRWAKNILQMFIIESNKLMHTSEIAKQILQEVHIIYIMAILPISSSIVEPHLVVFFEKYIPVLIETIKVHKYRDDITQMISLLLETFFFHLQSSENSAKLQKFKQNIYALLKIEIFEKYASI